MTVLDYNEMIESLHSQDSKVTTAGYRQQYQCLLIDESGPVAQDIFYGKRFCGSRGSRPFVTAVRPSLSGDGTPTCPDGHVACVSRSDKDAMICTAGSDPREVCPITQIAFVRSDSAPALEQSLVGTSNGEDAVVSTQQVSKDVSFITAKFTEDKRPVT